MGSRPFPGWLDGAPDWFARLAQFGSLVPRTQIAGPGDLSRLLDRGVPALVSGIDAGEAVRSWSAESLAARIGTRPLRVECYDSNDWFAPARYEYMTFADFLSRSATDESRKYYLADVSLADSLPDLATDFPFPAVIPSPRVPLRTLYLRTDTISAAHFHSRTQVLHFPIVGSRYFALYSPSQSRLLYREPWYSQHYYFSRVPFDRLRPEDYPRLAHAQPLVCKLLPGDVLYIPLHWWHLVTSLGFGIAITCAWRADWGHWAINYSSLISFLQLYLLPKKWRGLR